MAEPTSRPLAVAIRIADCFDEDRVPYAIGGALALGTWGAQRATDDVDMSVFVGEERLPLVLDALERAGVMVDREAAAKDVARIGMFKAFSGRTAVGVFLSAHPQYEAMAQRRRAVVETTSGRALYFISPEDLCLHKLMFGRPKDVIDLERLVPTRPSFDFAYVRSWLAQMVPPGDRRFEILDDLERRFPG